MTLAGGGTTEIRGDAGLSIGSSAGTSPAMRVWALLAGWLFSGSLAAADPLADLVNIHVAVMGGEERIAALKSFRATGSVTMNGKQVRFVLTAARPNLVRMETEGGGRTLVQGYDGVEPPWEFDTGTWPPRTRPVAEPVARRIVADAEFDDPIIAGPARGYALDYAGEVEVDGRKLRRILVTHKLTESFSLLLEPDTFLILFRTESRSSATGRPFLLSTRYGQFQPVAGVLLPHEMTTTIDGKVTQQMKIELIEPNPTLTPETFSPPKAGPAPAASGGQ
jgi:hypothetical protein